MIRTAAVALMFGLLMFGIGHWGRRNAATLVPFTNSTAVQQSKERAIRRGGWVCQIGGGVFGAFALIELFIWVTQG